MSSKIRIIILLTLIFPFILYYANREYTSSINKKYDRNATDIDGKYCKNKVSVSYNRDFLLEYYYLNKEYYDSNNIIFIKGKINLGSISNKNYYLFPGDFISEGSPYEQERYMETVKRIVDEGYADTIDLFIEDVYSNNHKNIIHNEISMQFLCRSNYNTHKIQSDLISWAAIIERFRWEFSRPLPPEGLVVYLAISRNKNGEWVNVNLSQ